MLPPSQTSRRSMAELVATIVAFPAVIPTVLLGVVLLYWLLVVVGVMDVDVLGAEGAADGVLEGAAEGTHGLLEGAMDGAAEGVADGVAEGVADGVADGVAEGADALVHAKHGAIVVHGGDAASVLSFANFRSVPVTVSASVMTVFMWLFCVVGVRLVPGFGAPPWLLGVAVLVAAFVLSLPPTALLIRPLARVFRVHDATSHQDLVGRVCLVTTGSVSEKFGQARLKADDLDLIVQVRSEHSALKRGDRALIVAWDAKKESFWVEPYDELLEG
jgi:hypothetical protein